MVGVRNFARAWQNVARRWYSAPRPATRQRGGGGWSGGSGWSSGGRRQPTWVPACAAALPLVHINSEPDPPDSSKCVALLQPSEDTALEDWDSLSWRAILFATAADTLLWLCAVACSLAAASLGLAFPLEVGRVLDLIRKMETGDATKRSILPAAVRLLRIVAAQAVVNVLYYTTLSIATDRMVARLRVRLFAAVLRQDVGYFDARNKGELAARVQDDVSELRAAAKHTVSMGLRQTANLLGGITMLWMTNRRLTQLMGLVIPTMVLIGTVYVRFLRKISRSAKDAAAKAEGIAHEVIAGVRTVRSFTGETREVRRFDDAQSVVLQRSRLSAVCMGAFIAMNQLGGTALVLMAISAGGWLVGQGELTGGELSSFIMTAGMLQRSLAQLSVLGGEVHRAVDALSRMRGLLESRPSIPLSGGTTLPDGAPARLTFDNVCFTYPSRPNVAVLSDLSVDLRPGTVTALVGHTGSGKSTVASLVQRFYDPSAGQVCMNGVPLTEVCPRWLRQQIGVVSQEPALFAGSIGSNIGYGRPGASDEEVRQAASAANCDEFLHRLPDGLSTEVGEGGVQLSGGQKQRVAIARALLRDPRILILDEATSALDAQSEGLVQAALERLMEHRTVLVIAHRLSTIQRADAIHVLRNGRVVESGTHAELMQSAGSYYQLVRKQMNCGDEIN
eukprot:TRINITY_DN39726_c0_g1_i1.p1 TRINITY_DN39726_c0_g1~~TRINITY_DN39726_c0_g1_i1.p1  ORF type:complete len:693 (+),score=188.84 TRINITY_DN39726_c0_g1_i1:54-2081(+)